MRRTNNALQRTSSSPGPLDSEAVPDTLFSLQTTTALTTKNIPANSDILHLKRPGTLRKSNEAHFWNVIDLTAKVPPSGIHPSGHHLSSQLQYVGLNRAATRLEFGFLKVDEAAREELCRRFVALNLLMKKNGRATTARDNATPPSSWPQFFFHENHYDNDFDVRPNENDYAHFHGAGLIHKDDAQLTHYHFQLGWKKRDRDGKDVVDDANVLPDHDAVCRLSRHYFGIMLQSLGIADAAPDDRSLQNTKVHRRLPRDATGDDDTRVFIDTLARLPVNLSSANYYDCLAEEGFRADPAHPISMNLERTPREIYAAAVQPSPHLPADDIGGARNKRRPGFKEFSDLYLRLKTRALPVSEVDRTANLPEALGVLKTALKRAG